MSHAFGVPQCEHYTVACAGAPTRVSIDFRVVPRSCHVEIDDGKSSDAKKRGRGRHRIGGFYSWMGPDGEIVQLQGQNAVEHMQQIPAAVDHS